MGKRFSIQFVARLTGLNAHTIRAWEKRYQAVTPERNASGKRIFKQEEVDRLATLAELVNLGNTISDIANLETTDLHSLLEDYRTQQREQIQELYSESDISVLPNAILQQLLYALHNYKLDIISYELEKTKNQIGARDFGLQVLLPLMQEVGKLVARGKFDIAQEHSLSAIVRFQVGHLLCNSPAPSSRPSFTIALATPSDELHEFGILIASMLCSHYKVKFYYFGPNLPAASFMDASKQVKADVLVLGVTEGYVKDKSRELGEYLSFLSVNLEKSQKLWVGGVDKLTSFADQENIEVLPTLEAMDQKLASLIK